MSPDTPVQPSERPSISKYRHLWLPELIVVGSLMVVVTIVFAVTDLDMKAAGAFCELDETGGHWPHSRWWLWRLFYHIAPWLTGMLAIPGVALVVAGTYRSEPKHLRLYGAAILLAGFLGPGLVVNGIFKDYWGHPRPRQMKEFGGRYEYVIKPLPGPKMGRGMSFPCGHCSVGFLYAIGWFIFRRKNLRIAIGSLAGGTVLGILLGISRLAAGGHFLSDTLWAGLFTHLIMLSLHYFILNVPGREDAPDAPAKEDPRRRALTIAGMAVVSVIILFILLYAHPDSMDLRWKVPHAELPAGEWVADLEFDKSDVTIAIVGEDDPALLIDGYVRSFGMPTNTLDKEREILPGTPATVRFHVIEKGFFADLESAVKVRLAAGRLSKLVVRAAEGDIVVTKEAGTREVVLDVESGKGVVTLP